MGEPRAFGISYQGEVLDEVGDGGGGPLDRLIGSGDMLDSFLARLEEVGEVGYTEGIEVRVLGGNGALVLARARAVPVQAFLPLEAVQSPVAGRRHGR